LHKDKKLLIENIDSLRLSYVKSRKLFNIEAIVILPEYLHYIWTLPAKDVNFSTRWNLLKGHFSRSINNERISKSRLRKREVVTIRCFTF